MRVLQHGGLPPHSFCRQIYHPEVKGGTPAEEWELQCVNGGRRRRAAGYEKASLLLRVFFPLKNKGVCRLLT